MCGGLGQVYRGRLRSTGKGVAVKVQRPGVREQIALDVHILRMAAAFLRRARKLNRFATPLCAQPVARMFEASVGLNASKVLKGEPKHRLPLPGS